MNIDKNLYFDELKTKFSMEYDCLITSFSTLDDYDILIAIDKAYKVICKYCDWNIVPTDYILATVQLATMYLNSNLNLNKSLSGVKQVNQITQGSRSVSYGTIKSLEIGSDGLSADIKAMLPLPKMRCFD